MSTRTRTGEPLLASIASWVVIAASFGLSASSWVALATLAGFAGSVHLVWPTAITLSQSWLLPIAADGYLVVALVVWLSPRTTPAVARFARHNSYAAALVAVATQSAYHALSVWADTGAVWRVVLAAVVGALPPGFAALAVHMRALLRAAKPEQQTVSRDIQAVRSDDSFESSDRTTAMSGGRTYERSTPAAAAEPPVDPIPPAIADDEPEVVPLARPVHPAPVRRRRGTAAARLADGWSSPLGRAS